MSTTWREVWETREGKRYRFVVLEGGRDEQGPSAHVFGDPASQKNVEQWLIRWPASRTVCWITRCGGKAAQKEPEMYDLKRSIRRHAVGCAGLVCLLLIVASTSGCTSDSITGGENPGPEVPGPENPGPADPDPVGTLLRVGSVTLPDSLTVAVHETAQLNAIVRDTDGAVIADPRLVFTVTGLKDGTVNRNGLVTGIIGGCGVGRVWAWSGGVNSNAAVVTVGTPSAADCRVVGSVTLSPDSL